MTEKSKEVERARGETQLQFEKRVQREMLAVGKKTDKMANAKYAGGVDLGNIKDAKGVGVAGHDQLLAESKKATKKKEDKK